ncbi:MAG: hypothetical protein R2911_28505 [Caldilineaceae bacterium]
MQHETEEQAQNPTNVTVPEPATRRLIDQPAPPHAALQDAA